MNRNCFQTLRHLIVATMLVGGSQCIVASAEDVPGFSSEHKLHSPLPEALTSFGATVLGD